MIRHGQGNEPASYDDATTTTTHTRNIQKEQQNKQKTRTQTDIDVRNGRKRDSNLSRRTLNNEPESGY